MKLKNFFYLLLALPLAFAACEEDPDVQPVVLKLTSEVTMDFDANGGTGAITYTLENAVEGIKLKATCADEWVKELTPDEQVTFTVVKNETTEARETKIVVSYDKASFEVTVKQAAKAADEGNKDDDNNDEGNKDDDNKDDEGNKDDDNKDEGNKDDENQPGGIVFELVSEPVIEVSHKAATHYVEYKLEDPLKLSKIEFEDTAEWITKLEAEDGEISFKVAANKGEAREAKVVAKYGQKSIEFTVKQKEYVAPEPVITIQYEGDGVKLYHTASTGNLIPYSIEHTVEGGVLTVATDVDWITDVAIDQHITFSVTENEGEERTGIITVTYKTDKYTVEASVKIIQVQNGFDPNKEYGRMRLTKVIAEPIAAYTWKLQLWENDRLKGDMYTNIIVKMTEKNISHINDGTYRVFDGTILPGLNNMNSHYRINVSDINEAITDAELTMEIDKANEKAKFSGKFATNSVVMDFSWDGEVDGFSYEEVVTLDNYTQWSSFTINRDSSGNDDANFVIRGTSSEGSLTLYFDIYEYQYSGYSADVSSGATSEASLAAGTYTVGAFRGKPENKYVKIWYQAEGEKYCCAENCNVNGYALESGEVVVEIVGSQYKVSFNVVDILGQTWVGEAMYSK